jgi:hypothetical protein
LLFVNDWFKTDERPLNASVSHRSDGLWAVKIQNPTKHRLTNVRIVVGDLIFDVGNLESGAQFEQNLNPASGKSLKDFVQQNGGGFEQAVNRRRNPLGGGGVMLDNRPTTITTASFYHLLDESNMTQRQIVGVPGLDMSNEVKRGDAVVFAWDEGQILTKPINQFQPIRMRRDSMLRLVVPVKKS